MRVGCVFCWCRVAAHLLYQLACVLICVLIKGEGSMRIVVAGPSGSGKTTFAARLGRLLDIPHTEMDSLH